MLCESFFVYVKRFLIYTGRDTILKPDNLNLCITSQVILTMTEPLLHKEYCLAVDNYYSSPESADKPIFFRTDTRSGESKQKISLRKSEREIFIKII